MKRASITDLPDEIVELIFSSLPDHVLLGRCALVCRSWNEQTRSEHIWRARCYAVCPAQLVDQVYRETSSYLQTYAVLSRRYFSFDLRGTLFGPGDADALSDKVLTACKTENNEWIQSLYLQPSIEPNESATVIVRATWARQRPFTGDTAARSASTRIPNDIHPDDIDLAVVPETRMNRTRSYADGWLRSGAQCVVWQDELQDCPADVVLTVDRRRNCIAVGVQDGQTREYRVLKVAHADPAESYRFAVAGRALSTRFEVVRSTRTAMLPDSAYERAVKVGRDR